MIKKGLKLKIYGKVQGVGFRWSVRSKAEDLNLVGWVKNVSDNTVECEVEGEEAQLEKFLKWIKDGPRFAKVDDVEIDWEKPKEEFKKFKIT